MNEWYPTIEGNVEVKPAKNLRRTEFLRKFEKHSPKFMTSYLENLNLHKQICEDLNGVSYFHSILCITALDVVNAPKVGRKLRNYKCNNVYFRFPLFLFATQNPRCSKYTKNNSYLILLGRALVCVCVYVCVSVKRHMSWHTRTRNGCCYEMFSLGTL